MLNEANNVVLLTLNTSFFPSPSGENAFGTASKHSPGLMMISSEKEPHLLDAVNVNVPVLFTALVGEVDPSSQIYE